MIEMVGKVKIDPLTHELVDYLMGEKDGIPKEPQHTFKLYRAIGNTRQAIKIAITIETKSRNWVTISMLMKSCLRPTKILDRTSCISLMTLIKN